MKKILVTGGAGFVGSHLCKKLLERGDEVICLDDLSTGNKNNIADLLQSKKFRFLNQDIINNIEIDVNEIYNLACPASPIHYQLDPVKTAKTSVLGVINMLELAKRTGARILHASTSEVYGDPQIHPQAEDYWGNVNPIGIRSCYDEGKRCAETLLFDYWRQYKVDIRVIRIFNTYGPNMNMDDGRVVSNFITQALKDRDITVYGEGSQTRSFQYIDDLIEGIVKMMENEKDFQGPINLGNPGEFTIQELAEKILAMTGSKSAIIHCPLPQDDPRQRKPDISLARQKLGWEPKVSLEEGLKKTIAYFQSKINE